ncbi:DUF423 domain-containing protein [Thalassotalea maritima]|uniref:DUF423 domain-containing protein n=1 Tax=Thalassotalea maritima TaxID=3242416 RepID=UPI00352932AA
MQRLILGFAGGFAMVLVFLSAWLSHAQTQLASHTVKNIVIAILFGFIHVLLLFMASQRYSQNRAGKVCSYLILFGLCCFSGLIILKSFVDIGMFAKLTPLAGIALAVAWPAYALSLGMNNK